MGWRTLRFGPRSTENNEKLAQAAQKNAVCWGVCVCVCVRVRVRVGVRVCVCACVRVRGWVGVEVGVNGQVGGLCVCVWGVHVGG